MRDILAGLLVLALLFGAVQSCRLSARGDALDEQGRAYALSEAVLVQCRVSLRAVDSNTAGEQDKAAAQAQAGREAAGRVEASDEATTTERVRIERVLVESKRDLTCAEQLEVQLCPSIPLL